MKLTIHAANYWGYISTVLGTGGAGFISASSLHCFLA